MSPETAFREGKLLKRDRVDIFRRFRKLILFTSIYFLDTSVARDMDLCSSNELGHIVVCQLIVPLKMCAFKNVADL